MRSWGEEGGHEGEGGPEGGHEGHGGGRDSKRAADRSGSWRPSTLRMEISRVAHATRVVGLIDEVHALEA